MERTFRFVFASMYYIYPMAQLPPSVVTPRDVSACLRRVSLHHCALLCSTYRSSERTPSSTSMKSDSSGGDLVAMRDRIIQAVAWKWRLLHALVLFRETYHIKLERMTAITCANDRKKKKKKKDIDVAETNKYGEESYMSGVELVWTERGQRLHMSRDCVSLQRSHNLRSKTICKLCARDHP
jgi:hypothetical protein